jgi:hypothetical protein
MTPISRLTFSSPNRRWAFLCAYNRRSNNPYKEHHHSQVNPSCFDTSPAICCGLFPKRFPCASHHIYAHAPSQYQPLDIVPNSAIMQCDNITDMSGKDFMDPTKDHTIKIEG